MRRWVCVIALLAGFTASDPSWSVRSRPPVPIERQLATFDRTDHPLPSAAWWLRA
jgi:hypothetical protein